MARNTSFMLPQLSTSSAQRLNDRQYQENGGYTMKAKLVMFMLLMSMWASPTQAQDKTVHSIAFDRISFSFASEIADNVNIVHYPGDPASQGPGFSEVRHLLFALHGATSSLGSTPDAVGGIRIYQIADIKGYVEHEKRLQQLQSLLDKRPDLTPYIATARNANENNLPFLPVYPAGQVLRARPRYIDTAAVKGISYVTVYQEVAEPLLSKSFTYTFQGISADGKQYISATFNLTTTLFPEKTGADFDPELFASKLGEYMAKSTALVDRAGPEEFKPSLTTLDAVVQSISYKQ
jgi:hypothetical protein